MNVKWNFPFQICIFSGNGTPITRKGSPGFQTELTQGFWILSTQNEVVESQTQLDSRISKSIVRENLASAPVHSYLWVPDSGVAG